MSRRRRLIERIEDLHTGFPAARQEFGTSGYAEPRDMASYATPAGGVQGPQNTSYSSTRSVYPSDPIGAAIKAYDPAKPGTYGATEGVYNAAANANGPINEAVGTFSKFNLAANPVYNAHRGGNKAGSFAGFVDR